MERKSLDQKKILKYLDFNQSLQADELEIWNSANLHPSFEKVYKNALKSSRIKRKDGKYSMGGASEDSILVSLLYDPPVDQLNYGLKTQAKLFWDKYADDFDDQWNKAVKIYFTSYSSSEILTKLLINESNKDEIEEILEIVNQKRSRKNTVLFYCESSVCKHNEGNFDYTLDFYYREDILSKLEEMDLQEMSEIRERIQQATIIRLYDIPSYANKYMREGSWYEIPISLILQWISFNIPEEQNLTLLVGTTRPDRNQKEKINFSQYSTKKPYIIDRREYLADIDEIEDFSCDDEKSKNWSFKVYDVGCGSCSKLTSKVDSKEQLFFDFGIDKSYQSPTGNSYHDSADEIIKRLSIKNDCSIIISHWDEDHVRLFHDVEQSKNYNFPVIDTVIAPALIPATSTNDKILSIIEKYLKEGKIKKFFLIAKPPNKSKKLSFIGYFQGVGIYLAALPPLGNKSLDPNNRGIVATVEGKNKIALLPGDHSFPHLLKSVVKPNFKVFKSKPLEMVIPHHGGKAGKLDEKSWNRLKYSSVIFSTRDGAYKNMPRKNYFNFFQKQSKLHSTDSSLRFLTDKACKTCLKINCNATKRKKVISCSKTKIVKGAISPNNPSNDYGTIL